MPGQWASARGMGVFPPAVDMQKGCYLSTYIIQEGQQTDEVNSFFV